MGAAFANRSEASSLSITTPTTFSSLDGSASDDDGLVDGVLTVDNLVLEHGGSITFNDPDCPRSASAGPIKIVVTANVFIGAGCSITAENRISSGNGGNILLQAGESLALQGEDGTAPGALISSRKRASYCDVGRSGNITIIAPNLDTGPGSIITAGYSTQTDRGTAGAVDISGNFISISGEVSSRSGVTETGCRQLRGGGTITVIGAFTLSVNDTAVISSRGLDPGADLVHLEAALVFIGGRVESTGAGNAIPDYPSNSLGPSNRPGKPCNSTGGVEIWADYLTIDGLNSKAEIHADIGYSDGTQGRGWIDLYAYNHIEVFGPATGDFAVHANGGQCQNSDDGGIITVKCAVGDVIASGRAFQADSTRSGGRGGCIIVEAATDLTLDTASLYARGDYYGSGCGGYGYGGRIHLRSFNGILSWMDGIGDVRPTGCAVSSYRRGIITLTADVDVDTTGSVFPANGAATTPYPPVQASGGNPAFPAYVVLPVI